MVRQITDAHAERSVFESSTLHFYSLASRLSNANPDKAGHEKFRSRLIILNQWVQCVFGRADS